MGFSLSHQSKINILDMIGNHFSDSIIEAVKDGKKLQGTGDNWDMKVHAHDMRSTHQNQDIHYFVSNLIVERVPSQNLSTTSPRINIRMLPNSDFLLSAEEEIKLREDFKVLIGRVLLSSVPCLSFLKSVIPDHISHIYQKEMSEKSIVVPLPMQFKDEKKYSEVVDILDEKAFDLIEHNILIAKLKSLGINSREIAFFTNYLKNRTQVVEIEGYRSRPKTITNGVPQGSVLGPLLFIVFINDLPKAVKKSVVDIYADDTTISASAVLESAHTAIQDQLQEDMNQVVR